MLEDTRAPVVLAGAPAAVVLTDARAPAVLADAPAAVMLADARAPAVLAPAPDAVMLADARTPVRRGSGVTTRSRDVRALTLWQGWNEVH